MKSSTIALLGPAALVNATWYGGAPNCAQSCLSSYWATASSTDAWPSPGTYCTATQGPEVASCLSTACSATPTAISSYSSLSSSLCSQWSSCSSAGSTGVYTISAPAFTGNWGGPNHSGGGPPHGGVGPTAGSNWDDWWGKDGGATHTWTGGAYTVTGCEWSGNPWAGGPGGWGGGGANGGYGPWGQWGNAWSWTTRTEPTVTVTTTVGSVVSTVTGPATVAVAVSGDTSSTSIIGLVQAAQTGAPGSNAAPGGMRDVKVVGAVLGAVGVVVALL